jgi:hypothetical protein
VFAALASSGWIEDNTEESLPKFVRTRRHRTIEMQAGPHVITPPPILSPTTSAKPSPRSTTPAQDGAALAAHLADKAAGRDGVSLDELDAALDRIDAETLSSG